MALNIVSCVNIMNEFRKTPYFRQNLGLVSTIDKDGRRIMNTSDKFAYYYNTQYKTTIYGQGNIGDIRLYIDHYITNDAFGVYSGDSFDEYIFNFDLKMVKEKGINFYLGHIIKSIEERHEDRVKTNQLKKMEPVPVGDADMLIKNPGSVSYEDVKAYLEKKNKSRYESK